LPRPRFAYFPFSGGLWWCIGQSLAMLEMQVILSMVAQTCKEGLSQLIKVRQSLPF
jgi:cytochrome P450